MYAPRMDLTNTPGIYYALTYGLSALLYIRLNQARGSRVRRGLTLAGIWLILCLFMSATYLVRIEWFIPCMLVDVCLIFLILYTCCDMPLLNTFYFTAQTFMLGEFAASLEWDCVRGGLSAGTAVPAGK